MQLYVIKPCYNEHRNFFSFIAFLFIVLLLLLHFPLQWHRCAVFRFLQHLITFHKSVVGTVEYSCRMTMLDEKMKSRKIITLSFISERGGKKFMVYYLINSLRSFSTSFSSLTLQFLIAFPSSPFRMPHSFYVAFICATVSLNVCNGVCAFHCKNSCKFISYLSRGEKFMKQRKSKNITFNFNLNEINNGGCTIIRDNAKLKHYHAFVDVRNFFSSKLLW